uniref:Uncharacterized protein n=1 Tax=Nelumbo nucifera TaxID=4432 RepID=A0A822ZT33_NELNU|nr:TPA_asm: hypothetical protein HUJ06_004296 [Nelumbo nucifera]
MVSKIPTSLHLTCRKNLLHFGLFHPIDNLRHLFETNSPPPHKISSSKCLQNLQDWNPFGENLHPIAIPMAHYLAGKPIEATSVWVPETSSRFQWPFIHLAYPSLSFIDQLNPKNYNPVMRNI